MRLPPLALAATSAAAAVAGAARVEVWWDVGSVRVNRAGHGARTGVGVNGTLPVAPVYATQGDTLVLHVRNRLAESTSVHAHGILQAGTPFMDGPAMVTQCGIPPNGSFTYEYRLDRAGTFWLHGHDHHQNSDGLRTPLVVYDRPGEAPIAYDSEYLLSFEDWYHSEFSKRIAETLDPALPFPPPASFPYLLVNGVDANRTQTLRFEPGCTYRIRLVNMATTEWVRFAMPGHEMRVIEADGVYSRPHTATALSLGPGQRYSVLVTAHGSAQFNFRYHMSLYASFVPQVAGMSPRRYTGMIEYARGAPTADVRDAAAVDAAEAAGDLDRLPLGKDSDVALRALAAQPPLPVDRTVQAVLGGATIADGSTRDVINGMTYAAPRVPTLYSALSLGPLAANSTLYGPQTNTVVLGHNQGVEVVIHNPNRLPHPMHLHGHTFQIIEYGPVDPSLLPAGADPPPGLGVQRYRGHPMRRDTVVVPAFQYVRVRFRASNPGAWLLHCHMDIHFAMGMAMTFVTAPDVLQRTIAVPDAMLQLCAAQGIPLEGNAAGNLGLSLDGLPPVPVLSPA
ncbi:ferroxidase fet3 [Coemansia javaensis]|uniref:Ferroxidase fet3 n=1 Tax=Coemansia javaensis TaxID=2761396 RepID=A0A9W8HIT3_9FUNG|nr:ferroxidase fet3 [Coemansia javaensis]